MNEFGKIVDDETFEEREVVWKIPNFSYYINRGKDDPQFSTNFESSMSTRGYNNYRHNSYPPDRGYDNYIQFQNFRGQSLRTNLSSDRLGLGEMSPGSSGTGKKCYQSPAFFFADNSWHFGLFTGYPSNPGAIEFSVLKEEHANYSVEYNFGIKKVDGSVERMGSGSFKNSESGWSSLDKAAKLPDLCERKSELVPFDVLTIICTLKRGTSHCTQSSVPKNLIKLDTLSQNFKDLYTNKDSCDTTLLVKDMEYRVHRAVLIARSSVFAPMFQHDSKEKQTGVITIPDCHPESFEEFLKFLYCGKLEDISFFNALHLYETSDKYDVQELKTFCAEYLTVNFTVENMCDVVIIADKYDDVKLISAAQGFFNKNFKSVFQTSEWECLLKNNYRLANKLLKEM